MNKEKITNFLIAAGVSAPVVMLLECVAISAGVIGDSTALEVIGTVLAVVSFLVIVVGMTSFASIGCKVERCLLTLADSTSIELLIAYNKDNEETPVAVLQRFDGDELKYELGGVHALLEGTFTDGKTEWTLLPDGTIRLAAGDKAKPYTVERFYHMLTNVVKLPDGRHVALQLTEDDELLVLAAAYDADEEEWEEAEPRKVLMRLPRKEQTERRDIYVVEEERLLTPAMLTFMDGDLDDVVRRYSSIDRNGHAIGKLNKALLLQWQIQRNNEEEDD